MAYSNVYDESTPADNNKIRFGPTEIRELKAAVRERMGDLVTGWTDGPIVLLPNIIKEAMIENGAVTENKIDDAAVTELKIKDGAVTEDKLADASVTAAKIGNLAIDTPQIKDDAVTNAKIHGVAFEKITDVTIATANIADKAVTQAKLGDGAVGETQLAANSVTAEKIPDHSIPAVKFAADAFSFTGFVKGAVYALQVNPLASYVSKDFDEVYPIAGGLSTDFYLFQWDVVGDGDANLEILVFTRATVGGVHVYFRDTGDDPSVIRGTNFSVLQLRISA